MQKFQTQHNCIPEHYVQILIAMSDLEGELERRMLTYTFWNESKTKTEWHPFTFGYADAGIQQINEIKVRHLHLLSSCTLFRFGCLFKNLIASLMWTSSEPQISRVIFSLFYSCKLYEPCTSIPTLILFLSPTHYDAAALDLHLNLHFICENQFSIIFIMFMNAIIFIFPLKD